MNLITICGLILLVICFGSEATDLNFYDYYGTSTTTADPFFPYGGSAIASTSFPYGDLSATVTTPTEPTNPTEPTTSTEATTTRKATTTPEPTITTQSSTTPEPTTTTESSTTRKATTTPEPTVTTQSSTTPKPTATTEPSTTKKATTTPEATITTQSSTTPKPTAITEPSTTRKATTTPESTITTQSSTTPEPTTTTEPSTTRKATTTPEPTITTQSSTTPEPTATTESSTTRKATTTPEATITTQSSTTPEPTATTEPSTTKKAIITPEPTTIATEQTTTPSIVTSASTEPHTEHSSTKQTPTEQTTQEHIPTTGKQKTSTEQSTQEHISTTLKPQTSTEQTTQEHMSTTRKEQATTGAPTVNPTTSSSKPSDGSDNKNTTSTLPQGYVSFGKGFYKFHSNATIWPEARDICENEGGYLAIINSHEEETFIAGLYSDKKVFGAFRPNVIFVGYHDFFRPGQWLTIDGKSVSKLSYMHWAPGQPDNTLPYENCAALAIGDTNTAGLDDYVCQFNEPFVCEISNSQEYPESGNQINTIPDGHSNNTNSNITDPGGNSNTTNSNITNPGGNSNNTNSNTTNPDENSNGKPTNNTTSNTTNPDENSNGKPTNNTTSDNTNSDGNSNNTNSNVTNPGGNSNNTNSNVTNPGGNSNNTNSNITNPGDNSNNNNSNNTNPDGHSNNNNSNHTNPGGNSNNTNSNHIPKGYASFGEKLYKFHSNATIWPDARDICENEGGYLAIINSHEEEAFIASLYNDKAVFGAFHPNVIFVGYHDFFRPGQWLTIDGQSAKKIGYMHWAPGQPDNSLPYENCAALSIGEVVGLDDYVCQYNEPFVCEMPNGNEVSNKSENNGNSKPTTEGTTVENTTPTVPDTPENQTTNTTGKHTTPTVPNTPENQTTNTTGKHTTPTEPTTNPTKNPTTPTIPTTTDVPIEKTHQDYISHNGSLYKFHNNATTWVKARRICESEGAHLTIINSAEEESFIANLYKNVTGATLNDYIFVGYHDFFKLGEWVTIDGRDTSYLEYTHWGIGQPDNEPYEQCGALFVEPKSIGLYNFVCHFDEPFVCESEIDTKC